VLLAVGVKSNASGYGGIQGDGWMNLGDAESLVIRQGGNSHTFFADKQADVLWPSECGNILTFHVQWGYPFQAFRLR
jgi:hypothetical protein